jgi:hypothetical protein
LQSSNACFGKPHFFQVHEVSRVELAAYCRSAIDTGDRRILWARGYPAVNPEKKVLTDKTT